MNTKPKILFIARDDGGCGFYRCLQPASFLNRRGLAEASTALRTAPPEKLLEQDLVVMQEMGSVEGAAMAKFMVENKIPFMGEIDDFLHHVSPHNVAGYGAWNPGTLYIYRAMEIVKKATAMSISTESLAREYFPYNDSIYVVPNYLDKDRWELPITHRQDDKVRIGWSGGNAHADDLKMIAEVINKLVKEYDGKVIFETLGMTGGELHGVFPMQVSSQEPCPSCNFEGSLHHFPGERYEDFPNVLASRGWDIAVAPVIDNAFGNAKSDLKVKEYAALGYPVVASKVVPYISAEKNGAQVLLASSFEDWYSMLKDLIDNPEKRRNMAQNNKIWAEGNWIQDRILEISEVYLEVIARYTQLHGAKRHKGV